MKKFCFLLWFFLISCTRTVYISRIVPVQKEQEDYNNFVLKVQALKELENEYKKRDIELIKTDQNYFVIPMNYWELYGEAFFYLSRSMKKQRIIIQEHNKEN